MDAGRYRPEIDGLRTVAVMAVVLFHLGVPGFSGGYTGVDVFFVISGFLITRLIVDEVRDSGQFSYARFYVRRIRRLFPALFCTILVSMLCATLLFSPEYMDKFAQSVRYAVLSISNFHFWNEADYFDTDAHAKPLLHTWSLSVEEQFYLVWPAVLVVLLTKVRAAVMAGVLVVATVTSLAIAHMWLAADPSAAFYLLPARIAEFMTGAAVVWLIRARPVSGLLADGLVLAGLGLIAYAVISFTPATPFPGIASLVPCLGAALVIYAGQARFAGGLLRLPPVVAIGRWSYSIYLVHWPLLVFYGAYTFAETTAAEKAALAILSIALGWLQYRFVEETFRHESRARMTRAQFAGATAVLAALLIAPAALISGNDGWKERIPPERLMLTNREYRALERKRYCGPNDPAMPAHIFTCQNYRNKEKDIVIWGDSHAQHLVAGFSEVYPDHNVFVAYLSGCVPQSGFMDFVHAINSDEAARECIKRNRDALAFLKSAKPTTVVITSAKRREPHDFVPPTKFIVSELSGAGHRVIVLGDFIRPGRHLVNCISVPSWLISAEHLARRCQGDAEKMSEEIAFNDVLSKSIDGFVNPNPVHCPGGKCLYLHGTTMLYRDDHHLTIQGSVFLLSQMKSLMPIDGSQAAVPPQP